MSLFLHLSGPCVACLPKKIKIKNKKSTVKLSANVCDGPEAYLTSSPAKSNTCVMVTLAGSDAFVSELKGASFNSEESS